MRKFLNWGVIMYICILVFVIGTIFASFIHVYVTRLLRGESIVFPRSHCTNCNHVLRWYEMIPIVSYVIQGGRCRKCSKKIDVSSFVVEITTGILFSIVYIVYGISYQTLIGFVIVLMLISIFLSDFKEMIILDSTLVVGLILIYLLILLDLGLWKGIYKSFLYGVFAFVLMFLVKILGDHIFKRESLGGGDIKLAFIMGSLLPYNLFLFSLIVASMSALPYALYESLSKRTSELAFGPFLMIGLLFTYLFKAPILEFLTIITS